MALKVVEFKYRPGGIVAADRALLFLSPLWAVAGPILVVLWLCGLCVCAPSEIMAWLLQGTMPLGALSLSAFCALTKAMLHKSKIRLSTEGIDLPAYTIKGFYHTKTAFRWTALQSVVVQGQILQLKFEGGKTARIKLSDLNFSEAPSFVAALYEAKPSEPLAALCKGMGVSETVAALADDVPFVRGFSTASFVPLVPGTKLQHGRIHVEQPLVVGGLSAIYLVRLLSHHQAILKEANVPETADEHFRTKASELFTREAALLAKLRHDRIAQIYDHFVEGGRQYILMELIPGRDLRRHVQGNGVPEKETLRQWCLQIAELLQYLHEQSPAIIHRDLTPDNLVLRDSNQVVLIDFGAANQFLGTATGTLVGKQAYVAPEQFRGKAQLASDIYSFGCTMHFLATGKDPVPLSQSHPKSTAAAVEDWFDALVSACTDLDHTKRPDAKAVRSILLGSCKHAETTS